MQWGTAHSSRAQKSVCHCVLAYVMFSCSEQVASSFVSLCSLGWEMKAAEAKLLDERKRLRQDKQALEVDLEQVKKERDLAKAQIASTSGKVLLSKRLLFGLITRLSSTCSFRF